ncbi:MAG: agmatine deiminase family protein [Balneolaceae bacterium]
MSTNHNTVMPAEWEPHHGTLLVWPHNRDTWPGERLVRVEKVYTHFIEALTRYEPVYIAVADQRIQKRAQAILKESHTDLNQITFLPHPVNDVWARDSGPIMVRQDDNVVALNWRYNAWGEKYPPWDGDNRLPITLAEVLSVERADIPMVLEGGSIDVNGCGTLLTTESVLLNPNRNPQLDRADIEAELKKWLGVTNIIWLGEGLAGDDTDGHIDDLSRFVNKNTIVTAVSDDVSDPNYHILKQNLHTLQQAVNENGVPFHIVELPLPMTKIEGTTVDGSEYVPASYANFYIANGAVFVPMYDKRYDEEVISHFADWFPSRDIIGIECADLVWGQGSLHCITQQLYRE